jgi:uncharacterized protein DUF2325
MMGKSVDFEQASTALFQSLAPLPAGPAARHGGRKLWSLPAKYHCPVIGTCLPMESVRRIAVHHGLSEPRDSDYQAHVSVVGCCESRNPVSMAVHRELDRRHRLWVSRMGRMKSEAEVATAWAEALAQGEAAGAYWALLTCRAASEAQHQQAFQDIHMLSHQVGAGTRADLKALADERQAHAELRTRSTAEHARLETTLARRDEQIQALRQELTARGNQVVQLQASLQAVRAAHPETVLDQAAQRIAELERNLARLAGAEAESARLSGENANLRFLLRQAEDERNTLERFVLEKAEAACAESRDSGCPALGGRRLLCVGGRCNLTGQYRDLVEKSGGQFVWHDGGRDEGMVRLQELLAGADAVICPADCVSHPAYYQIKRHCKRTDKPCVLLRNSGLASFAAGLARLSRGEVEIGGSTPPSPPALSQEAR